MAAEDGLISLEHDGICIKDRVVEAATLEGILVAVKPAPDAFEFAAVEHPELDWQLVSNTSYQNYHALRQRCKEHVTRGRVRPNNGDFADLLVAMLSPTVYVPTQVHERADTYELFGTNGVWVECKRDHMG